ncbi:MAG: hypothetical protein R3F30_03280 [Planctomycetota bacterium]
MTPLRPRPRCDLVFLALVLLQPAVPGPAPADPRAPASSPSGAAGPRRLRAWSSGPARVAITDPGFRGPCRVLRGAEPVGRGEVLDWLPAAGLAELRARVEAGELRLERVPERGTLQEPTRCRGVERGARGACTARPARPRLRRPAPRGRSGSRLVFAPGDCAPRRKLATLRNLR